MTRRHASTDVLAAACFVAIPLFASCRSVPSSVPATGGGKGAFDTRPAYDQLMQAQGQKSLRGPDTGYLAWGESYVMASFVTMYEATDDTAYLDRLVQHADSVLARRDSVVGTKDYRGRSLPGWSAGEHYSIGELRLIDATGAPTLYLRSALTGYNHQTEVTVTEGTEPGTFTLHVRNAKYRREDTFENLTMDRDAANYAIPRIRASRLAQPYSAMRLHVEDLGSTATGVKRHPVPVSTTMNPSRFLWPVHQGMIFEPMLSFARTVLTQDRLRGNEAYRTKAETYIAAAEKLFCILEEGWRENDAGEGWYEVEKGAPVWMDGCDEPHNHFLALGAAMLHLAAATGDGFWRDRVEKMAHTIRNDMRHVPDGDLYVWPYWWSKGKAYNGWTREDDVSRNTPGKKPVQSMEDFSHGSIEINFAYRCYRDGIVFTRLDLERLANTFQHNIVRRTDGGKLTFANRVDGSGGVGRYDRLGPSWPLLAEFKPGILDTFREIRRDSPWIGYTPWLLQSANMNLIRRRLTSKGEHP